jgi:hypothetical protein
MYALIGRVEIEPGHEDETAAMAISVDTCDVITEF